MKIEISGVRDRGNLDNERVVLKVLVKTDIGRYALAATRRLEGETMTVSNKLLNFYWFPDGPVEAGDFVSVCTKAGTNAKTKNKAGSTTHWFYMGRTSPVWDEERDTVIVLEISDWEAKSAR